uniref:FeS cluster biogenesis domain-containing protein n=1 Tax=Chrysotila carterae TaxID=13221 RepID=A0A7S4EXJ8_CHRCT
MTGRSGYGSLTKLLHLTIPHRRRSLAFSSVLRPPLPSALRSIFPITVRRLLLPPRIHFNGLLSHSARRVFESHGAKVVVDECSLTLLRGATVDFEDDMMRTAFVIAKNPVADSACGCGSSFQPRPRPSCPAKPTVTAERRG